MNTPKIRLKQHAKSLNPINLHFIYHNYLTT